MSSIRLKWSIEDVFFTFMRKSVLYLFIIYIMYFALLILGNTGKHSYQFADLSSSTGLACCRHNT